MRSSSDSQETLRLKPGTLWAKVREQTKQAIAAQALQPLATRYEMIEQNGIDFIVRVLSADVLQKKEQGKPQKTAANFNPFLPYDENLFVADISDTHLCLLNKYNALADHLLLVTREFEAQESWLTQQDFTAMWAALAEIDGLVFYNAGKRAGASQRHKHLQLVPLPLATEGARLPIEPTIAAAVNNGSRTTRLPFVHAVLPLDFQKQPFQAADATLDCYYTLLNAVGITPQTQNQHFPYNLLATRDWMLLVPRTQDEFAGISVNALGFAGNLLVREEQLQTLKEQQPMTILQRVAIARTSSEAETINSL
ncbi:MAG: phosphorylase [Cyanophyceae cyanobacterium]